MFQLLSVYKFNYNDLHLFSITKFVRDNDVSSARELLNKSDSLKPSTTPNSSNSCHPLCSCPKCSTEIGQEEDVFDQLESSVCDEQSVTAYSRDDMGGTGMHQIIVLVTSEYTTI